VEGIKMGKKMLILFVINLMILSSIIIQTGNVKAIGTTFYVDIDGDADYTSIQDAINNANTSDIIFVYNGTYYENIVIDKSISLMGENKLNTIIDGNDGIIISIFSDDVSIESFTITDGSKGVFIDNHSGCIIKNNTIMSNDYGVFIGNLSLDNIIYYNNFINNDVNAFDSSINDWYYDSRGNYWNDYDGIDNDDDEIGDSSYNISGGINKDFYPFMNPLSNKPIADFYMYPISALTNETITLTDKSIGVDNDIIEWFWDLGDGNTSIEQNLEYKYTDDGVYNISLEVTDSYGSKDIMVKTIIIENRKPISDFEFSPIEPYAKENIQFIDKSRDYDGVIINWTWVFGDDNSISKTDYGDTIYSYDDNGDYIITLIVIDDDNQISQFTRNINVKNNPPNANIKSNKTIIKDLKVDFVSDSSDIDGEIIKIEWNLDGKIISDIEKISRVFTDTSRHTLSLTVWDDDGASNTFTKNFDVIEFSGEEIKIGLELTDYIFIVFIIIMVVMVILLSRRYGLK
jgi:PKD repeat protein